MIVSFLFVGTKSDNITYNNVAEELEGISGILVAPGFGGRGIDGKLAAVKHARNLSIYLSSVFV